MILENIEVDTGCHEINLAGKRMIKTFDHSSAVDSLQSLASLPDVIGYSFFRISSGYFCSESEAVSISLVQLLRLQQPTWLYECKIDEYWSKDAKRKHD